MANRIAIRWSHVQQVEPTPDRKTQEREDGRAVRCGRQAATPTPLVDITTQSTVNEQLTIDKVSRLGAGCTGQRRPGRGPRCSTSCQEKEPKVEDGGSEFEEEEDALPRHPKSLHRLVLSSIQAGRPSQLTTPIHEHDLMRIWRVKTYQPFPTPAHRSGNAGPSVEEEHVSEEEPPPSKGRGPRSVARLPRKSLPPGQRK